MRFKSTAAEIADQFEAIRRTRNVDLSGDPPPQPVSLRRCGKPLHLRDLPDKLMPRRPAKSVITAQNLQVSVAYARQPHAHQRPPRPQLRQRLFLDCQFAALNDEREHSTLFNHQRSTPPTPLITSASRSLQPLRNPPLHPSSSP